ncbi:hypothetical protein D3C73_599260 [compost metagenome]
MKRFFSTILICLIIVVVLLGGLIWYVKPAEELDLSYEEVPIAGIIMDMVKLRKAEVRLSEHEINQLIKKHLSEMPQLPNGLMIEGASFQLQGDRLEADVNVLWDHKVTLGAKLVFQLVWKQPNLEVIHTETHLKAISVPLGWFQLKPIQIPIEDQLPRLIGINEVVFDTNEIRIRFKLK